MASMDHQSRLNSLKLDTLEQQRHHLHQAVDAQIDRILMMGRTCVDGTSEDEDQVNILEVSQLLNSALTFFTQKSVEISNWEGGSLPPVQLLKPESSTASKQSPQTRNKDDDDDSKETDLSPKMDPDSCQQILLRLGAVEKVVASLMTVNDKITVLGNNLGEMSAKQCEIDERVEGVSVKQCEMDQTVEEMSEKLSRTEGRVRQMSAKQNETNDKIEKLSVQLHKFDDEIKDTKDTFNKMDQHVSDLSTNQCEFEKKVGDIALLCSSVSEASATPADASLVQTICTLLTEVDRRMTALEKRSKSVQRVAGKYDKVEFQYKMVCQIVADRLLGLEKLRDILNKKLEHRNENIQKLHDLEQQVSDLTSWQASFQNSG